MRWRSQLPHDHHCAIAANCRAEGDDKMKPAPLLLLLPLAWISLGFAQSAPQQPPAGHTWRQSQRADAAKTMTYTRFTLTGKFISSPQDQASNRPALAVDCIPGKGSDHPKGKYLAANLLVGTTLKIDYIEPEEIRGMSYLPKVAARYRTDDAADEEKENWSPGADKTSASIPKDSLKKILRAHTFAITADDEHGSPIAMQFDMPDPTLVEASCNVDKQKE
jgi:hypothetical protein